MRYGRTVKLRQTLTGEYVHLSYLFKGCLGFIDPISDFEIGVEPRQWPVSTEWGP